jgi:Protein of unknown function (DUF3105)
MRFRSAAFALAASLSLVACGGSDGSSPEVTLEAPSDAADTVADEGTPATGKTEGVMAYEVGKVVHTEDPVTYAQTPPVGGDHHPGWQNCGAYADPVPTEQGVHSMEHGAVWVTYDPALPAGDIELLQALTKRQTHILVSPFPGLPSKVVASAWGVQLALDSAQDARLTSFIETYQNGPQTPEPGAPCSGALGTPL